MKRYRLRPLLALVAVSLGVAASAESAQFRSGAFVPPRAAPDFALRASDGSEFRLSQHRGKVIALTFGYTLCPDVCPTILAELAQMRARIGEAARRVQVVYVSVDPERDSLDRLRAYTGAFDRTFLGLTGPADQLDQVWKAYGVSVTKRPSGGLPNWYTVHHSAFVYLIDAGGRLLVMLPFGTPVDDLVHDVKVLLNE